MKQAKVLKKKLDAAQHKEVVLKVRVQPWIDEAFIFTTSIEAKLTQMQGMQEQVQGSSSATTVSEQCIQEVQQAAMQCTPNLAAGQAELGGLRAKIYALTE